MLSNLTGYLRQRFSKCRAKGFDMALMIPPRIALGTSGGEIEIFKLLKQDLDSNDFVCLHSVGIARHQRKDYAEADFIAIGPSGIFCLEVKGGDRIERKDGLWTIGSKPNAYQSVEGPFKQAQGARWPLIEFLRKNLDPDIRKTVLFGWGVMFPGVEFLEHDPEWDNDVIYDIRDKTKPIRAYFERLEAYFRRRLSETNKQQPPKLGPPRLKGIVDCLRGDFEIVQSFHSLLNESQHELVRLSPAQFGVLDSAMSEFNPRILCIGPAGSGKTLVAMEGARRLAESGRQVLFLCFNNNLGRFLSKEIVWSRAAVSVSTIYKLLSETILKGGYGQELAAARSMNSDNKLFDEIYPRLFESAACALLEENEFPQYDALVIDEAQDILSAPIMNCLDLLLRKGFSNGQWLVFLDDGMQSKVYNRVDQGVFAHLRSLQPATFLLAQNYRNPKDMVSEMCALTGVPIPVCKREINSIVDYRIYKDKAEQAKKLRAILVELLREQIPPGSITILSAKNLTEAIFHSHPPDVGKSIVVLDDKQNVPEDAITAGTIAGFKGLENEFIVLTDVSSEMLRSEWGISIIYVGMTRARTKLFVLVDERFIHSRM
jgi:Nuclease-related domain